MSNVLFPTNVRIVLKVPLIGYVLKKETTRMIPVK